jgi:hypothetical protein
MKHSIFTFVFSILFIYGISQTTHTINLPSSGTATINVNCSVGDVLKFQSSSTPLAIRVFRNPAPNFTVTPTGNSTSYTVTATDTSYSSIVSFAPVTTCVGKIILSVPTSVTENIKNDLRLTIFPNPTSSIINVVGLEKALPVCVYDVSGKIVFELEIDPVNNRLDLSNCKSGIYFIRIGFNYYKTVKD